MDKSFFFSHNVSFRFILINSYFTKDEHVLLKDDIVEDGGGSKRMKHARMRAHN